MKRRSRGHNLRLVVKFTATTSTSMATPTSMGRSLPAWLLTTKPLFLQTVKSFYRSHALVNKTVALADAVMLLRHFLLKAIACHLGALKHLDQIMDQPDVMVHLRGALPTIGEANVSETPSVRRPLCLRSAIRITGDSANLADKMILASVD